MIFKCKNCAGNMVYSPDKEAMYCSHCDSVNCEETTYVSGTTVCVNCGGEIHVNEYTSASQCTYCGSYTIFDERVSGEYEPHLILPFKLSKEAVKKRLYGEFKKRIFAPSSFLSEAKLDSMEGMYVPFWMYDYKANYDYEGKGTKVRIWTVANMEYTETSIFSVKRNLDISFQKIPVDASIAMEDGIMDLMEPYSYEALENFQEKYMSGFFGEMYNEDAKKLESRASSKARNDSEMLLNNTISGYSVVTPIRKDLTMNSIQTNYALLPVWIYTYKYKGETYRFHINGQTGKLIGKAPISTGKVMSYGGTVAVATLLIGFLVKAILGVL